jgi:hypothetical protein
LRGRALAGWDVRISGHPEAVCVVSVSVSDPEKSDGLMSVALEVER